MSRPLSPTNKTANWSANTKALKRRGSLTVWFDPEMIRETLPSDRRGRPQTHSGVAIQTRLPMTILSGLALRQTTRFVDSVKLPGQRLTARDVG